MGTNAITVHLPDNQRQAVIFEIQIGVPVPIDSYPMAFYSQIWMLPNFMVEMTLIL